MTRDERIALLREDVEHLREASVAQERNAGLWRTYDPSLYPAAPTMADNALTRSERYALRAQALAETLDDYEQALTNVQTLLNLHKMALSQWGGFSNEDRNQDEDWIDKASDLEAKLYQGAKAMSEEIATWLQKGK